jgi:CSLREA domain-containing protein
MRQAELRLLLGLLALLAPLLFQPSIALAQAFTVTSTLDEPDLNPGDGLCVSAPSGVCTLRAAIMEANGQGGSHTISLPAGTFKITIAGANEDGGGTGDFDIFANLTITGAGANSTIVDGNKLDRVFDVHTGVASFALAQLAVVNGSGTPASAGTPTAGGIHSDDAPLSLTGVTLRQHDGLGADGKVITVDASTIAENGGGGLSGTTIAVTNSTISSNSGQGLAASTLTVTSSTVTANTQNGIQGQYLTITGCTINNNGQYGVYVAGTSPYSPPPPVESVISDTRITGNAFGVRTSGFWIREASSGPLRLVKTTVQGNHGLGVGGWYPATLIDSVVADNEGNGLGSASGPFVLTNTTVTRNKGDGIAGGGQLTNSTVSDNTEQGINGGGTLTNSTVSHNGGLGISGGGTLTNSTVSQNKGGITGPVNLTNSQIVDNHLDSGSGGGLNITGTATIVASTIGNNSTPGSGGGIYLADGATLALTNSTISGNSAATGGGIYQAGAGTLSLTNATIANNTASANGSGLYKVSGTTDFKNTIVANNTGSANCFHATPLTSLGNNIDSGASCSFNGPNDLSNTDPKLGPLTNNGGPTQTQALLSGSPAIDRGNPDGCPATDQRGVPRPQDGDGSPPGTCDIGAFEAPANTTPPPTTCAPRPPVAVTSAPNGSGGLQVTVATSGSGGAIGSVQFGQATNAQLDAPGGPPNATGSFNVSPPSATSYTFTVRRATAGQAVQVPFTVVDACGAWPTFVGGGPTAF